MSDRKYRHRGYMDSDRDDRERRPRQPRDDRGRPRIEGAPRGRGVGMPAAAVFRCAVCGLEMQSTGIGSDTPCPSCGKPLHSCTNCSFFNPAARFECTKPIPERIEALRKMQ